MDDSISFVMDQEMMEEGDKFIIKIDENRIFITREDWHKIVSFINENFK